MQNCAECNAARVCVHIHRPPYDVLDFRMRAQDHAVPSGIHRRRPVTRNSTMCHPFFITMACPCIPHLQHAKQKSKSTAAKKQHENRGSSIPKCQGERNASRWEMATWAGWLRLHSSHGQHRHRFSEMYNFVLVRLLKPTVCVCNCDTCMCTFIISPGHFGCNCVTPAQK